MLLRQDVLPKVASDRHKLSAHALVVVMIAILHLLLDQTAMSRTTMISCDSIHCRMIVAPWITVHSDSTLTLSSFLHKLSLLRLEDVALLAAPVRVSHKRLTLHATCLMRVHSHLHL